MELSGCFSSIKYTLETYGDACVHTVTGVPHSMRPVEEFGNPVFFFFQVIIGIVKFLLCSVSYTVVRGGTGGQTATTPDSEKFAKKRGKSGKNEEKYGRKGKNREGS